MVYKNNNRFRRHNMGTGSPLQNYMLLFYFSDFLDHKFETSLTYLHTCKLQLHQFLLQFYNKTY